MKQKLTVRTVDAISPAEKDVIVWDSDVGGFGVKVTPRGRKTYFLYYRTRAGEQRRPAIGAHGSIKPEAAREIAKRWLTEVAQGNDPSRSRSEDRSSPTMHQLCDRYLSEHAELRKKPRSIAADRRLIKLHIVPSLGSKKVSTLTRADISALHHSMRQIPYEANRVLALLSKMLGLAEVWNLRTDGSNPARRVERFKERKRERYLSTDEIARLWQVLCSPEASKHAMPSAIAALKLLIMTGRRLSEVLTLEWKWVDLTDKVLRLPDSKSGALLVSLGDPAIQLLADLKAEAGDARYVIRGKRTEIVDGEARDCSLVNLQKPWRALRRLAKLEDVRIHDLRHTFASVGAGLGMSLPLLGRLLGHTQPATTARYAHLSQNPVRAAADAIGAELERMAASG